MLGGTIQPLTWARVLALRVAFALTQATAWLGGLQYYRNLFAALRAHGDGRIEPVLFVGRKYDDDLLRSFGDVESHRTPLLDRLSPAWTWRGAQRALIRHDGPLERLLHKHGASVLSHANPLGRRASLPAMCWIPDFQHTRLPELFDADELARRDKTFHTFSELADRVIVSSHDAQNDLRNFDARGAEKSRVLQFVAQPVPFENQPPLSDLKSAYGIEAPFFHLPNQFWKHKNHRTVIDALRVLKERDQFVRVVATGATEDFRHPGHYEWLLSYAREQGVDDRFISLGAVPFPHVAALMRESIALVNPSLFEGWSTTVEESKSSGKRMVLSSIPVHIEQDPPGGVYFPPEDAEALADALWQVWDRRDAEADQRLEEQAREAFPGRQEAFARRFEEIAHEAADAYRGRV